MFIYLDESGDTGFKFPNSSRYFVIALLIVDDPVPFHAAIDELRNGLGFARGNEFKFYSSSHEVRWSFFRVLQRQDFKARVLVVDKMLITRPEMRKRENFYQQLVKLVLSNDGGTFRNAMLVLDESDKSKKGKQQFSSFLRQSLNSDVTNPKIKDIRYHRSNADNMIQAADMISGALYAKHHRGNGEFIDSIRSKIEEELKWPGDEM